MQKQKIFQILYVALIIGLLLFMIFMVFWLKSEGSECMKDSISYFEEKNNAECFCYQKNEFAFENFVTNEWVIFNQKVYK